MGGKPTTNRAARKRMLRRNAAAALVGHRDSRVSSAAGSASAEFVHLARSTFISQKFFDAPSAVFRSPLVLRCTAGGKRLDWTADVHRPQLPALRNLPLSAEQLEFLVEWMGAEVRGVECDGVAPRQLLRAVRERFTCFQPTYFHFRPPTQEGAHFSSFFAHIRKLFVPERTFVFLPTIRLECGVEELRDAVLAVLLVEKDRPLNCATAAGLLRRATRTARRFHALLRRLPTVELSEVVLVTDVPPTDKNDGEDGELPDGDFERTSGVIGDLRADRTAAWFAELCGPADTFACETVDRRHRLWLVQRTQGDKSEERVGEEEKPLERQVPTERMDEKSVEKEENAWASDQADEHDETAADRAEKPVENDLWSSDAPPVDLTAELEARLVAAMDAEGIPLPEAGDRSAGNDRPQVAGSSKSTDQPKPRGSSKKADKRKKKRSKPSH
ncbi:hypothetical protein M3Y99_00151700 [Aphelenchoides fujianensis]|nr:hypothetical protein M3Y99_00151700 [Aphelenchoides fujianensis]